MQQFTSLLLCSFLSLISTASFYGSVDKYEAKATTASQANTFAYLKKNVIAQANPSSPVKSTVKEQDPSGRWNGKLNCGSNTNIHVLIELKLVKLNDPIFNDISFARDNNLNLTGKLENDPPTKENGQSIRLVGGFNNLNVIIFMDVSNRVNTSPHSFVTLHWVPFIGKFDDKLHKVVLNMMGSTNCLLTLTRGKQQTQPVSNRILCISQAFNHKTDQQKQTDAIQRLLDAMKTANVNNLQEQAYILATVDHETQGFVKLHEQYTGDPGTYFINKYYDNESEREQLGNLSPQDAINFKGRGYVHVTGRYLYQTLSNQYGYDFIDHPELMEDPTIAAKIAVEGMRDGVFRNNKLDDYLNQDGTFDYTNARDIINGVDGKVAPAIANTAKRVLDKLNSCI